MEEAQSKSALHMMTIKIVPSSFTVWTTGVN